VIDIMINEDINKKIRGWGEIILKEKERMDIG
jgi:hypothetical protein